MRTSLLTAQGLAGALLLVFTLAACGMGGDGGGPGPSLPTAWVFIDSHEPPGDIVQASEVDLFGKAECDNCPPSETAVGYCPAGGNAPLPSAINVTVINQTTGESGIISHGITGHCSCLFSYCFLTYAHRWAAYSVPLTWGENVIVATASGAGFAPGTDSITITRAPGTVGNLQATSGKQQVTLRWNPVPDATSYNIYWSTERLISKATGTMIAGVNSPYTHTGLVDGQTYYYMVTSVRDGGESAPSSVAATPGWLTESVTAMIARWTATSIAMDSAGKAHISSVEVAGDGYFFHTYYMTNVTGAWSSLLVDQSSGPSYVGVNADIALDSQNTVHMSLVNSSGLNHAIYASGTWVREVVDPSAICDASLVLDAANKAHMVYYTPNSVRYATNLNGTWMIVVIEELGLPVSCINNKPSLGVDAAGAAHVAYVSRDSSLRYGTNQGGTWSFSSLGSKITGLSLVVDTRGAVHIVYGENTNYQLHYLHNKSGTWTSEIISSSGYSPSLSLDAAGKAHVSYYSTGLSYASNSSGTWHSATIHSGFSRTSTDTTDIAVDSQGKAHIVYSSYQGIRYATNK